MAAVVAVSVAKMSIGFAHVGSELRTKEPMSASQKSASADVLGHAADLERELRLLT